MDPDRCPPNDASSDRLGALGLFECAVSSANPQFMTVRSCVESGPVVGAMMRRSAGMIPAVLRQRDQDK
jgi:hypothetical protein